MAAYSIPHQYTDYSSFSTSTGEFCSFATCDETSHVFNNSNNNHMAPLMMNYDINSPVSVASSFTDHHDNQFGVINSNGSMVIVPQMSEIEMGFSNFAVCDYGPQYDQVLEPGDDQECMINVNGLVPKFYSNPTLPAENWALQGNPISIPKVEEAPSSSEVKVGRYSAEERRDRILRYLKKRNHRNFNKTIKYACRKTLADKRVRVRGRFAKNNEHCDEEIVMNATSPHYTSNYEQNSLIFDDSFQMKYDEDCLLQAAMASLMNLPYC